MLTWQELKHSVKVLYESADPGDSQVKLCSSCSSLKSEQDEFPVKDEYYSAPINFLEVGIGESQELAQDVRERSRKPAKTKGL